MAVKKLDTLEINDQLREEAAENNLLCNAIQSSLHRGIQSLENLPSLIRRFIERKAWYNLYVHQTKQFVSFDKYRKTDGTFDDQHNFLDFVTASMPEGLHTTPEKIERLIQDDPDTLQVFRQLVYRSRQGDHQNPQTGKFEKVYHSGHDGLHGVKSARSQKRYRAVYGDPSTGRPGAPPLIKGLYKQQLINLDLAAKLGAHNPSREKQLAIDHAVAEVQRIIDAEEFPAHDEDKKKLRQKINRKVKEILGTWHHSVTISEDPQQAAKVIAQRFKGKQLTQLLTELQQLSLKER